MIYMNANSCELVEFAGVATQLLTSTTLEEVPNCGIVLRTSTEGYLGHWNHLSSGSIGSTAAVGMVWEFHLNWARMLLQLLFQLVQPLLQPHLASWPMFPCIISLVSCQAASFMPRKTHGMLIPRRKKKSW